LEDFMSNAPAGGKASGFREGFGFLKAWLRQPKSVGSVWPTSAPMARRMAGVIDLSSGLPVLEVGPGTGTITKAILQTGLPHDLLWSLEYSHEFAARLKARYPSAHVIEGDAFQLTKSLGSAGPNQFDSAISALPLLNFPLEARVSFVEQVLDLLPAGRPLIQFSYGPKSPVPPGLGRYKVRRVGMVLRNIPPAQLWVFSREAD
jgi:phosphatidylethanolamine/phosphatidyl-N-methylethanolamine N-methyltransferase